MKKKRIFALASCFILAVGACGCNFGGGNASDTIPDTTLVDYESYKGKQNITLTAWDFPQLEYLDGVGYDTPRNNAIIQDIVAAHFDVLNLTGTHSLYINTAENIQLTKEQIALCNQNGLKSVVFGSNTGLDNENILFTDNYPDFSDCEGFYGFMPWDEPNVANMNKLGLYAEQFNEIYRGTDAIYHVNLLPSYAAPFTSGGYDDYMTTYGEEVLSKVEGEKWMMVDSYPINPDGTLFLNFLYDLIALKTYSIKYDAKSQMSLMSTATGPNLRSPIKEEIYTQAYAALAMGMDGIAWYTYSTPREPHIPDGSAPVKNDGTKTEHYDDLKEVNATLKSFGHAYQCFDWQGVMFHSSKQTSAMNFVKRNTIVNEWVLTAEDTKSLESVDGEGDFIIGVMKDELGNDGFMVTNYSDKKNSASATVEFTFSNMNYLRVYKNGEIEDLPIVDNKITLPLNYGEGALVIPYYKN